MNYRSLARWIAWKLPWKVIYWVLIRAWSHATTGGNSNSEAPGMTMNTVMERWDRTPKEAPHAKG